MKRGRPNPVFIIIGLLLLVAIVYLDLQGRYFLSDFKAKTLELIREKIGLEGTIGAIEGGIFRGITLKDVKLYSVSPPQDKPKIFFSSEAIELDYRLWDVAFGKYDTLDRITLVSPKIFFPEGEMKFSVPKVFEPSWKEIIVSIKDGSFYNAQKVSVISELNGNFKVSESGIESHSVAAHILGQEFAGKGKIGFPIERSTVRLEGAIKGSGYTFKAQLAGALDKIFVQGSFDMLDKLSFHFAGDIAVSEGVVAFNNFRFGPKFILNGLLQTAKKGFSIDLFPEDIKGNATAMGEMSKLGISGDFSKLPYFTLSINANHLKLMGFDLLSNYTINGKLDYGSERKFESVTGDFSTSGSIINYNPIREIKGAYEIKDGKLKLNGVNYGDVAFASGSVAFSGKNDVDIHLKFKGAQLAGLTDLMTEKDMLSGLAFGDIFIRGELGKEMRIEGQLEFLDGNISFVRYNSAKLTLKGKGSILEFIDSKVYTDEGTLMLEGTLDLADLGTSRIFRNIEIKSDPSTVVWAGINVIKTPSGEEYVTGANLNEQFRVNFKTYEAQQTDRQSPKQDEVQLEYSLGKPGNLKVKMREDDEFVGVEHKVRF